jgi:hypothetical protein
MTELEWNISRSVFLLLHFARPASLAARERGREGGREERARASKLQRGDSQTPLLGALPVGGMETSR